MQAEILQKWGYHAGRVFAKEGLCKPRLLPMSGKNGRYGRNGPHHNQENLPRL